MNIHTIHILSLLILTFALIGCTAKAPSNVEAVDLGLSVKWANMNVGATEETEMGDYFAWGETSTKRTYSWNEYVYENSECGKDNDDMAKLTDIAGTSFDAATCNWGGGWHMPNYDQVLELVSNCTWTWTNMKNSKGDLVYGYVIVSNVDGYTDKSIFLPAAGYRIENDIDLVDDYGSYWSSSIFNQNMKQAWFITMNSEYVQADHYNRYYGHTIRAVMDK
ncbi:MAG: hypothetical protein J6Y72_10370 [Bacteroidales bacterium]|nr:hypothetical protein [Bacteroidales bacterium]